MSVLALVIMCVVIVGVLSGVLFMINRTSFKQHQADKQVDKRRASVQGGTHVGGGRSVMPRRDEEVHPDADPNESTVSAQRRGNSPMDL